MAFLSQGAQCSGEAVQALRSAGGRVVWLTRDIRGSVCEGSSAAPLFCGGRAARLFAESLAFAAEGEGEGEGGAAGACGERGVVVTLDMSAVCAGTGGAPPGSAGPGGLNAEELLELARLAGRHPRVACVLVADFHPESEEARGNLLLAQLLYHFALGLALRPAAPAAPVDDPAPSAQQAPAQGGDLVSYALYVSNALHPGEAHKDRDKDRERDRERTPPSSRPATLRSAVSPLAPLLESAGAAQFPGGGGDLSARTSARLSLTTADSPSSSRPSSLGVPLFGGLPASLAFPYAHPH